MISELILPVEVRGEITQVIDGLFQRLGFDNSLLNYIEIENLNVGSIIHFKGGERFCSFTFILTRFTLEVGINDFDGALHFNCTSDSQELDRLVLEVNRIFQSTFIVVREQGILGTRVAITMKTMETQSTYVFPSYSSFPFLPIILDRRIKEFEAWTNLTKL